MFLRGLGSLGSVVLFAGSCSCTFELSLFPRDFCCSFRAFTNRILKIFLFRLFASDICTVDFV